MANLGLLLKSLMGPRQTFQPGGGNLYQAMQEVQQPSAGFGAGTPGEIRRGPDGKTYQYAQTSGMAGSPGDQGWIEANPSAFGGGLRDLLDPSIAFPMAGAMIAADTPAESFGNALKLGGPALGKLKDQRRANDYLSKNFPDLAAMVSAGMPVDDAWSAALKKKNAGGDVSFGKNPIWGLDEQGNPVMGVVGDDGSFKQVDTPGFNISKTPIKLDAGTQWILLDPITRQPVGQIPKDLAGAEAEKARGKGEGEAGLEYERIKSKMPGLERVVTELDGIAEKATYTSAGQVYDIGRAELGMEPREAALARTQYISMVDNQILPLLRDTFGAQFTQKEGETLRATLGDPNKTPKEKQVILKSFIEQKRRDVEALATLTGQPAPGGDQSDPLGLRGQ